MYYKNFAFSLIHRFREKVVFFVLFVLLPFVCRGVVHQDRTDNGAACLECSNFDMEFFLCGSFSNPKGGRGVYRGENPNAGIRRLVDCQKGVGVHRVGVHRWGDIGRG